MNIAPNVVPNYLATRTKAMNKEVRFIFIDESVTVKVDIASLTGLVIPVTQYEKVRKDFYKIISGILDYLYPSRNQGTIYHEPPILHGRDFLRNSSENPSFDFSSITDDFRLEVLRKIINIVNDNDLYVIRLGYNNYKEICASFSSKDEKLHNLNWFNLSRTISHSFNNILFIPVMEGIDSSMVSKFCNMIWTASYISEMYPEIAKSLVYSNSNSFVSSVFFTQSKFTEAIQIVDIITYLLQKVDSTKIKRRSTSFAQQLSEVVSNLNEKNLLNSIVKMNVHK